MTRLDSARQLRPGNILGLLGIDLGDWRPGGRLSRRQRGCRLAVRTRVAHPNAWRSRPRLRTPRTWWPAASSRTGSRVNQSWLLHNCAVLNGREGAASGLVPFDAGLGATDDRTHKTTKRLPRLSELPLSYP